MTRSTGTNLDVCQAFCADQPHDMRSLNMRVIDYGQRVDLYTYSTVLAKRFRHTPGETVTSEIFLPNEELILVNEHKYSITSTRHRSELWHALYYKDRHDWSGPHFWTRRPEMDVGMSTDNWPSYHGSFPSIWSAWTRIVQPQEVSNAA